MNDQFELLDQNKIFRRKNLNFDILELIDREKPKSLTGFLEEFLISKHDNVVLREMEKMGFSYSFILENESDFTIWVFEGNDHEIFFYKHRPILEIMWSFIPPEDDKNQNNICNIEFKTRTFEGKKE